ncbi:hypothetical protein L4679_004389 [Pseudomonas aeruginosa]|nr:hypothetical protein [Pseudomonas aeruginosa]EKY0504922.1 hypothetical protein [Pseudomonas aeruginosa]
MTISEKNTCSHPLIIVLIIIGIFVAGSYIFKFYNHSISANPEQWGQLGDYIGGTLNPILSFITIILLIKTLIIQKMQLRTSEEELALTRKELEKTAEAATRQASHFERESKLKEHLALIDKLATRINRNFNENKLDNEKSLHEFTNTYSLNKDNALIKKQKQYYSKIGSKTQRVVQWISSDLERLAQLIKSYEETSGIAEKEKTNISPIPKFYQQEFGEMVSALHANTMLSAKLKEFYAPDAVHSPPQEINNNPNN